MVQNARPTYGASPAPRAWRKTHSISGAAHSRKVVERRNARPATQSSEPHPAQASFPAPKALGVGGCTFCAGLTFRCPDAFCTPGAVVTDRLIANAIPLKVPHFAQAPYAFQANLQADCTPTPRNYKTELTRDLFHRASGVRCKRLLACAT